MDTFTQSNTNSDAFTQSNTNSDAAVIVETDFGENIIKALEDMRALPYYQNEAAASGLVHNHARHEDALSGVLKQNGFNPFAPSPKLKKGDTMQWMDQPELSNGIPNGTFIEQPFGKQQSPDYIIKVSETFVLFLEAKSSATSLAPTYNSGIPHKNFIYVFCAKKINGTTIYKGDSIITLEQHRLIAEHIEEARRRDEELNQILKLHDTNHRGISYYTRPMITQAGGADYTDYFSHTQRASAEASAVEWVREQCYSK
jgi:hypothetical protein